MAIVFRIVLTENVVAPPEARARNERTQLIEERNFNEKPTVPRPLVRNSGALGIRRFIRSVQGFSNATS